VSNTATSKTVSRAFRMQTIARAMVMEGKALLSRLEEFEEIAARMAK